MIESKLWPLSQFVGGSGGRAGATLRTLGSLLSNRRLVEAEDSPDLATGPMADRADDAGAPPLRGQRGRYHIVKKLAEGGMAEILLARSTGSEGFEKYVVLKRLLPRLCGQPRFVRMLLDEARLGAQLLHHNIGQVYDFGGCDGQYFIAMEYLHGVDLLALLRTTTLRRLPLSMEHALTVIAGVAAALDYAHTARGASGALNVVHRDVSPSNIVITYQGGVKLVDFGIARAAERDGETRIGALKGKISYMSPEQCQGYQLDHRSDIFSLGIVMFETTTRTRLFRRRGEAEYQILRRIMTGDFPRPSAVVPNYPVALEQIVLRALAVDPEARYPSAAHMLGDLERFAARSYLRLSVSALGRFVTGLFGDVPVPWLELEASGVDAGARCEPPGPAVASADTSPRFVSEPAHGEDNEATTIECSAPVLPGDWEPTESQGATGVSTALRSMAERGALLAGAGRWRMPSLLGAVALGCLAAGVSQHTLQKAGRAESPLVVGERAPVPAAAEARPPEPTWLAEWTLEPADEESPAPGARGAELEADDEGPKPRARGARSRGRGSGASAPLVAEDRNDEMTSGAPTREAKRRKMRRSKRKRARRLTERGWWRRAMRQLAR